MDNQEKTTIGKAYSKDLVKWGRLTNIIGIIAGFLPIVVLLVVYGFHPNWTAFGIAFAAIAAAVSIGWLTDPVAYVPIFGAAGTMMAFLSGNANALRLPAVVVGTDVAGTTRGTPENEVITILSMCASVAMSTIVLTVCAIGGTRLLEALPTSITSLFNYMLPAVFGGVITQLAFDNPDYLIPCFVTSILLRLGIKHGILPSWVSGLIIIICIAVTITYAITKYNLKKKKQAAAQE